MNELMHGFEKEIVELKARITKGRAKLEDLDDPEACALARFELRALEKLLRDVTRARDAVAVAESEALEGPVKFRKWRGAVAKAREAKLVVESFERPIERGQTEVDQAENRFQFAQAALADHLNHPIQNPDYESPKVIKKWEERLAGLQTAVNDRSAELRAAKETIGLLRRDWMKATEVFNACAFTERMLRLPQKTEAPGIGTLSTVS